MTEELFKTRAAVNRETRAAAIARWEKFTGRRWHGRLPKDMQDQPMPTTQTPTKAKALPPTRPTTPADEADDRVIKCFSADDGSFVGYFSDMRMEGSNRNVELTPNVADAYRVAAKGDPNTMESPSSLAADVRRWTGHRTLAVNPCAERSPRE